MESLDPYRPPGARPVDPPTDLPDLTQRSIIATGVSLLCCNCIPIGVVALYHADKSKKALRDGDEALARFHHAKARSWLTGTYVFAAIAFVINLVAIAANIASELAQVD